MDPTHPPANAPGEGAAPQPLLGILGGLGPLASAEFLRTLYELAPPEAREQAYPRVVLLSDPTFPDRTERLLAGRGEELVPPLERSLRQLLGLGAERIVICCYTLHAVLPRVDPELSHRVLSLVDLLFAEAGRVGGRHLLAATRGSRQLGLFERDPRWHEVSRHFALPDPDEQEAIHAGIYRLKAERTPLPLLAALQETARRHGVSSCAVGCTEVHVAARQGAARQGAARQPEAAGLGWLDPLTALARDLRRWLAVTPRERSR